jgi:LPS-assembly protein
LLALCLFGGLASPRPANSQLIRLPSGKGEIVEISADGPQKKQGDLFIADQNVLIQYGEISLRADHVEYNYRTHEAAATGHVTFDYDNQHIEASQAQYNLSTATGKFHEVRGDVKISRRPNPLVLVTDNPLHFEARDVDKLPGDVYLVRQAWITVCDPEHPKWQFFARRARIRMDKDVALVNANFRFLRVPLIWVPYATAPAGPRVRQSGFLIPDIGNSNRKGVILGDAFYWAPSSWFDTTLGAQYLSKRGSAERTEIRATPDENTTFTYNYFGVIDRGLRDANGILQPPQGGHQQRLEIQSLLPNNWRFVTDFNQLSSLTFRLAFADAYGDAINSEVRSSIFLTNNFKGFSLNFAALNDKNFLTINPETSVSLRNLPEARLGSVEQAPWRNLPVYLSFDSYIGGSKREDANLTTSTIVQRTEFAPRVTIPLHLGAWLGVTATGAVRTTRYGASLDAAGNLSEQPVIRNDGEFTLEIRPPTLERFFDRASLKKDKPRHRYKHTIEPDLTFRYVGGINDFQRFIRFDADATLSNTSEIEYGITQRLFLKSGDDQPNELVSWRLVQKHYFDPTFGGAIVDGQRNVLQALNSITPFAFALGARNWSPIVSDIKVTPGGKYDAEQILEYDPQLEKITAIGSLIKVKPYSEFFATVAHFRFQADPALQPLSNQVRALFGYGSLNRKGFNATAGISYDVTNGVLQNQIAQINYNGGCCGIALEYRRINLGPVRTENQFRVAFIIANLGTFGNLRRQEKIF